MSQRVCAHVCTHANTVSYAAGSSRQVPMIDRIVDNAAYMSHNFYLSLVRHNYIRHNYIVMAITL